MIPQIVSIPPFLRTLQFIEITPLLELKNAIISRNYSHVLELLGSKYSPIASVHEASAPEDCLIHLAIEADCPDILNALISYGVNINQVNSNKVPALHFAIMTRRVDAAITLITSGADIELRGPSGEHAMHHASAQGNIHILSLLLEKGCDINARDDNHDTPLHYAIGFNERETISYLIEKHASTTQENLDGINAEDLLMPHTPKECVTVEDVQYLPLNMDLGISQMKKSLWLDFPLEVSSTIFSELYEEQ